MSNRRTLRVMVVDHHVAARRGIRALIESKSYLCFAGEACNSRDALQVAMERNPDVVITEYFLPDTDGVVLAEALRQIVPHLPVVLFTINDQEEILSRAIRKGVGAIVLKSDSEDHLLKAVDAVAARRSYFSPSISGMIVNLLPQTNSTKGASILTEREAQVVQFIAEGLSNRQVGEALRVTIKTVETHRGRAMRKLNLRSTADLVRFAVRNHMLRA